MRSELVELDIDNIKYIILDEEKNLLNDLESLDEKRFFLYKFWLKRDPNSGTPQNEYKISFYKRIIEANKLFKGNFVDGSKTDRGRIYIVYGKPDDIERFPFQSNTKGYEIWKYDYLEGGATLIFVEQTAGFEDYRLVHSTLRNEVKNDNWERELSY